MFGIHQMNCFPAIAVLALTQALTACVAAAPAPETVASPREQMRVLSVAQGKGPDDALGEDERSAVELARNVLAIRMAGDPASYELVRIEGVEWSDSSLGCPQPGQSYLQVITPGHRVEFSDGRQSLRVHTANGVAIVCAGVGKAPFQRPGHAVSARALDRMRGLARENLAGQLGVPVDDIDVRMLIPSQWPDASLGCPEDGVHYPPGVRTGFRIPLAVHGRTFFYHTDGQRVFPCPPIATE